MISALKSYGWEKSFLIGKKNFNLALGMGPYFGPMRALEKGLASYHFIQKCLEMLATKIQKAWFQNKSNFKSAFIC